MTTSRQTTGHGVVRAFLFAELDTHPNRTASTVHKVESDSQHRGRGTGIRRCWRMLFINSRLQGLLTARVAGAWVIYHVLLWHALFLHHYMDYLSGQAAGATPLPFRHIYAEFVDTHTSLILCAVAVLPLVMLETLRQTHRFAGPLDRVSRALRRLTAGSTVAPLQVRMGDPVHELITDLNNFLAMHQAEQLQRSGQHRFVAPKEKHETSVTTSSPESALATDVPERVHSLLDEIDSLHDALQNSAARPMTAEEQELLHEAEQRAGRGR